MTHDPAVLIVEDNENEVFMVQTALERASVAFPVTFVRDGQEAIDHLSSVQTADTCPRMVLLDLRMPRYNGFEVLTWIRQQPGLRRMPVVIFTSSDLREDVNRAYDLGANSYLLKPVGMRNIADLIQQIHAYWLQRNLSPDCRGK
jgi:CheY-like chemotaxis protein